MRVPVQIMLVDYLFVHNGNDTANWCEKYWTGDHGQYCLVHSRYAGLNTKMGVEVSWGDTKKTCNALSLLGAFIGVLCHFRANDMGEENMKHMKDDLGVQTAFISTPVSTKSMWDLVQEIHLLTIICCIVVESPKHNAHYGLPRLNG
jgi:hypothetical protein